MGKRRLSLGTPAFLRALWGDRTKDSRNSSRVSATAIVELAAEHGYFITKARRDHVYVPRKRVADDRSAPLVLERDLSAFFETADKVISDGRTRMPHERLFTIWQALANTRELDGSMAEIGVWHGGTSFLMAQGRKRLAGAEAPMIAIDTFQGHPGDTLDASLDLHQRAGAFGSTSVRYVQRYLSVFESCDVIQGDATKVLLVLPDRLYFLVHVDTDIHASTVECLRYFYPRLVPGGVIVVDDFGAEKCPGVTRAVHDCLPSMDGCHVWQMRSEQCVVTKVRGA